MCYGLEISEAEVERHLVSALLWRSLMLGSEYRGITSVDFKLRIISKIIGDIWWMMISRAKICI